MLNWGGFDRNGAASGMQPSEMQNGAEGNMPEQENVSQAADAGTPISAETLILLGVSAIILLVGCVVAICYKRRG